MQNADDALVARLNNDLRDSTKTLEDLAEEGRQLRKAHTDGVLV